MSSLNNVFKQIIELPLSQIKLALYKIVCNHSDYGYGHIAENLRDALIAKASRPLTESESYSITIWCMLAVGEIKKMINIKKSNTATNTKNNQARYNNSDVGFQDLIAPDMEDFLEAISKYETKIDTDYDKRLGMR